MEAVLSKWLDAGAGGAMHVPVGMILPRLLAALAIGVLLAVRPWRFLTGKPLPKPQMMQAQILLCSAAAVITIVIGDSLAKAFGLVGLGSFVRFRSGLKDPRDAAILFLVIGLGMACGHGSLGMALAAAVFVSALLAVLDQLKGADPAPEEEEARALAGARARGAPAPAATTPATLPLPLPESPSVNVQAQPLAGSAVRSAP
jgi:hypothetical protein